jgi:hypothetical protein
VSKGESESQNRINARRRFLDKMNEYSALAHGLARAFIFFRKNSEKLQKKLKILLIALNYNCFRLEKRSVFGQ